MTLTRITNIPRLSPRKPDAHKGDFGRVLILAGNRGKSGAAVLCGTAALRGGAGLVTVGCPSDVQDVIAAGNPCYMTIDYVGLEQPKAEFDVLAVGPGIDSGPWARWAIGIAAATTASLVVDADGLNGLSPHLAAIARRSTPAVLTPHPGEFARLIGKTTAEVQANREALAVEFAATHKVVLLLKGQGTIVTDGSRVYVNATGNPGMATGGCGDVLTGLIAALLGRKLPPFEAACLGAWAQGRAGDLAAEEFGQTALIASDLLAHAGRAFREVESGA